MKRIDLFILFLFFLAPRTFSQNQTGDFFTFKAKKTVSVLAKGKEHTVLSGGATVSSKSFTIDSERIELFGEDFSHIVCTGKVKAFDRQKGISLECEKLFYDRKRDFIRIETYAECRTGKCNIIKGGYFEHNNEEEITIVQIGVRILRKIWHAVQNMPYNRKTEILNSECPCEIQEMITVHRV